MIAVRIGPDISTTVVGAPSYNRVLALPEVRASLEGMGMDVHPGSVAAFTKYVRAEVAKWARMVKSTGVSVE